LKVNGKILFEIGVLLVSLFYLVSSIKLSIGELSRPGPGFFPIALGAAGVVIASLLVAGSFLAQQRATKKELDRRFHRGFWTDHQPAVRCQGQNNTFRRKGERS